MLDSEKEAYENGFKNGVMAARVICNPQLCGAANSVIVKSQPECSTYITNTLEKLAGIQPAPTTSTLEPWEKPKFSGADLYVKNIDDAQRRRILGYVGNEEAVIVLVGHVETRIYQDNPDDNGFGGDVEIYLPDEGGSKSGRCLGYIQCTGTAIIVSQEDQIFAFTPENAMDRPWSKMTSDGAELIIGDDHQIVVRPVTDMKASAFD
jgi:hypothetical protein